MKTLTINGQNGKISINPNNVDFIRAEGLRLTFYFSANNIWFDLDSHADVEMLLKDFSNALCGDVPA